MQILKSMDWSHNVRKESMGKQCCMMAMAEEKRERKEIPLPLPYLVKDKSSKRGNNETEDCQVPEWFPPLYIFFVIKHVYMSSCFWIQPVLYKGHFYLHKKWG